MKRTYTIALPAAPKHGGPALGFLAALLLALLLISPGTLPAQTHSISLTEAVLKTLQSNPGIRIEEERVLQKEGELQRASGQFDWVALGAFSKEVQRYHFTQKQEELTTLSNLLGQRYFSDSRREQTTLYSVGVRRQTRSGIVFLPSLSTLDIEDLSADLEYENRSDMSVEFIIPLMRGFGEASTGALETAAQSSLSAAEWASKHNVSGQILETAAAYWSSLAAAQIHEILEDTGRRADELNNLVELLVRGGEAEPAILHQARAKLLQRRAEIRQRELDLYESRQRLAIAMGYGPGELTESPRAQGPFPPVVDVSMLDKEREQRYIRHALAHRGDYLAAQTNIATQDILLKKAEKDKKPRLDFDLAIGYTGLSEKEGIQRYWSSLYHDKAGPGVFAGLNLEWPIENKAAIGEFIRQRSLAREAMLTRSQLSNSIGSEVLVAMERLRSSIQECRLARESAAQYKEAAKFENYKVRVGESSLNALIDIEDRYYEVRITEVLAERRHATALAQLRFVTGTLLSEEARNFRFKPNSLMTLPLIGEP